MNKRKLTPKERESAALPRITSKKPRTKKAKDKTYYPHAPRKSGSGGNPLDLRINKNTNPQKRIIAICNLNEVEGIDPEVAAQQISEYFTEIRNGVAPDVRVLERNSEDFPTRVGTPGGREYELVDNWRSISFFSDKKSTTTKEPLFTIQDNNPVFQSRPFAAMVENKDPIKRQRIHCTKSELQTIARENRMHGRRLATSRIIAKTAKDAKEASATSYAQATGCFPKTLNFQNCHVAERGIRRKESPSNLVIGSYDFNTNMCFIEKTVKGDFIKAFPDGFYYDASSEMVRSEKQITHIAASFTLMIEHDELKLPYDLNPQTENQPHRDQEKFVDGFTKGVIAGAKAYAENKKKGKSEEEPVEESIEKQDLYKTPKSKHPRCMFFEANPKARRALFSEAPESNKENSEKTDIKFTPSF